MISSSKSSSLNANASDGGILTFGGIAPLTIYNGSEATTSAMPWKTLGIFALGIGGVLLGLWLIVRK